MSKEEKSMHIGIILDGNRRYAKKKGLMQWQGHKEGANKVAELMDWVKELGINEITLYSFSVENFNRSEKEKDVLFKLFKESIKKLNKDKRIDDDIRINFIGRLRMFPKDIVDDMKKIMERTKNNKGYTINFAMAYGGRQEIVDAAKKIASKVKSGGISEEDINEDTITDNLYLSSEPDMIIRPGGEKRVSNFLLWQSYYSEWHFTDKLWPEFTKEDLINAIEDYNSRERRLGK